MNGEGQEGIKTVCVIGCGASGLPVVKALVDRQISFDCFEAGTDVGGNWTINNSNGMSAAYESLRSNTTKEAMQYADLPMSESVTDYPDHRQIKNYFDQYCEQFELRQHIVFNTRVDNCERNTDGSWQVTTNDGKERSYQHLIVANGHHWAPSWPKPAMPGNFDGLVMHSHSYMSPFDPVDFSGKKIVILGTGNSAMDIACELSQPSFENTVYLSIRNTPWILPRYVFGRPIGGTGSFFAPWKIQSYLTQLLLRVSHGTPMAHGLPQPAYKPLQSHPTISQFIYDKIDNGDVIPKANIKALKGSRIAFVDGSEVDVDVLIYATGYKVSFPFFQPELIAAPNNKLALWQHMIKPDIDNLFFVGLFQPLGAVMPLAEKQAKLIGDVLLNKLRLPPLGDMLEDIEQEQVEMRNRYPDTERHTMQVDGPVFDRTLDQIRVKAASRARNQAAELNAAVSRSTHAEQ